MKKPQLDELLKCTDEEIAVKSFFLGPRAENGDWLKLQLNSILENWYDFRKTFSVQDGEAIPESERSVAAYLKTQDKVAKKAVELQRRFEKEIPKFSPRYLGHMFSELSMPSLLGHWVALLHNPNNISREASLTGLEVEQEAIGMLLKMFGMDMWKGKGHFTSGGTVANFEALLRARARQRLWINFGAYANQNLGQNFRIWDAAHLGWEAFNKCIPSQEVFDDFKKWNDLISYSEKYVQVVEQIYGEIYMHPALVVSAGAHYSWAKACDLFGVPKESLVQVPLDSQGRMCVVRFEDELKKLKLQNRPVLMCVSLAGSTELGTVDSISEINQILIERFAQNVWHHVDAAYGGFFCALVDGPGTPVLAPHVLRDLGAIKNVTSVTVDPHKLGYVPYASGVFLCADRKDYPHHNIDAPYIDFRDEDDPGLHTLEGSRAATGAAATWLTGQAIGFNAEGYGRILKRTIVAKQKLESQLIENLSDSILIPPGLDLNILCFALAHENKLSAINTNTQKFFEKTNLEGSINFAVSRTIINLNGPKNFLRTWLLAKNTHIDSDQIILIRSCLMNPFFTSQRTRTDFVAEFVRHTKHFLQN